jgi:hypothetical protein
MKKISLFILLAITTAHCTGQEQKSTKKKQTAPKNGDAPVTQIEVNKEYDEQGNLIRYDSTYSYYYSNIDNNTNAEDSVLQAFRERFEQSYPFAGDPYFEHLFFQDTLLLYDFYKNDFFLERFRRNSQKMEMLFRQMDSLKNSFYSKQFK